MGKIKLFKSLTFLNVLSVFGVVGLILMMTFQTLLAGPILGGASGATGGGGGTYANDWGSDTTNWKKGGVLVITDTDVSDNTTADLGTNYRFGTFLKGGVLYRANAVGCKEVLMPYSMYAKNYSDGSYDNMRYYGNSAMAAGMRAGVSHRNNMPWVQGRWTDGNNNGRVVYGNYRHNGSNAYRTTRQNRSRHRYTYLADDNRSVKNYGMPVICKK